MAQDELAKLAQQIAQALANSGVREFDTEFTVNSNANDIIVVAVARGTRRSTRHLREMTKSIPSLTLDAPGNDCPCCNGSGRTR